MPTITYFNNIRQHIIESLDAANHTITICVAWLTDEIILQTLVNKSKEDIHIEIITQNDEYNRAKANYFNKLIAKGCKVYFLDKNLIGGILHNKFCVIDRDILITGSYNWTYNATSNSENIIILTLDHSDEPDENAFTIYNHSSEFERILYKYEIKNEKEECEKIQKYIDETQKQSELKRKEAKDFFDKAHDLWHQDRCVEALECINNSILLAPDYINNFYMLRHLILKDLKKYSECYDDIIKYLECLSIGQDEYLQQFKQRYEQFINALRNDYYSFQIVNDLNQKNQNKISIFKKWSIEPHTFTKDDFDIDFSTDYLNQLPF
jgi:hypothetical protein